MEYKHFSHPHNLTIYRAYELGKQVNCSGCEFPCDNTTNAVHACHACNFFLHDHCANAPRYVKHPCHKPHPLILLPYPTYAGNTFVCNACNRPGKSFSYCCALCELDLHVGCAFLPFLVTHRDHEHELHIDYRVPVVPRRGSNVDQEYCNICKNVLERRNWAYCCNCNSCEFSVHTACATNEVLPGLYQDDGGAVEGPGTGAVEGPGTGAVEGPGTAAQADGGGGDRVDLELTEEQLAMLMFGLKLQTMAQSMATLGNIG